MFGAKSITWLYHLGCVACFLALAHAQGGPPQDQNAGAGAAATTASPFVVVHTPDGEHSTHVTDMRHLYVPEKRAEALHETVQKVVANHLGVREEGGISVGGCAGGRTGPFHLWSGKRGRHDLSQKVA